MLCPSVFHYFAAEDLIVLVGLGRSKVSIGTEKVLYCGQNFKVDPKTS
jgi:hypothetical protein